MPVLGIVEGFSEGMAAETMMEVKVEKADNGYIVKPLNFTGNVKLFKTFAEMSDYLFDYFNEKAKP